MNIHSIAWKSILRLQQIYPKEVGEICRRIGLPKKILLNPLTEPGTVEIKFYSRGSLRYKFDGMTHSVDITDLSKISLHCMGSQKIDINYL